ncbi:MAG: hypothetical protein KBT02_00180 [Treponema sp.]|nr:hypothetical protein [Candidatus Treponema caballi]
MTVVILSIFLMGGSVIGIYLFLEDLLLDLNRKKWEEFRNRQNHRVKKTA